MKSARLLAVALLGSALVIFLSSPAHATTVNISVSEDGYTAMGMSWYMDREYCKAYEYSMPGYDSFGYTKFAMDTVDPAVTGDWVSSARLNFYVTGQQGAGLTSYGSSETGPIEINAYADVYTANTTVSGTTVATNIYGGDPTPHYASVEITDIAKSWLDSGYANHGIKIENPVYDGKAFYWNASEAAANQPYLELTYDPPGGTITCPVNVDTYAVPMGGPGYGYPINTQVKSMADWLTIPGLVGFDLEPLDGYSGSDVISADFKFYRLDSDGGGMSPATAPAGTDFTATIHALDDSVTLTEDLLPGDPVHGVIDLVNRPNAFGSGYSASNDTGPNTWAEADITQIVKDWLDGTYANNGIEFQDDTGPAPDDYVWYWNSIQAAENHPYLEVTLGGGPPPGPELTTTPADGETLAFGNVRVGTSADEALTATNSGGGTLEGTFPAASGDFGPGSTLAFILDATESDDRPYTYAPGERGSDSLPVTITSNDGNSTVTLDGQGVGPVYGSNPGAGSTLDLGQVMPGESTQLLLDLTNDTSDPDLGNLTNLTLLVADITGADAGFFSLLDFTPGTVLEKDELLSLLLEFSAPVGTILGGKSATLTFFSDEGAAFRGDGASFAYALHGSVGEVIPEPAGIVLFGLGSLGVLVMLRRRRKRHYVMGGTM